MSMKSKIKKYVLEKDSIVEVYKIFGDKQYFAVVEMNGRYPRSGKIAQDINREEFFYTLEGELNLVVNNKKQTLKKGKSFLVKNNDKYFVEGKGKMLVFVKDEVGGESKIITG